MATFTASAAQSNVPAIMSVNRTISRVVQITQAAALSAGDVLQMVKVPNGCNVSRVQASMSLSAGVVTVNIGDGNDTSAYAASLVYTAGGALTLGTYTFRGLGRSYSAEDTIDIQITALSAVPGTAKIKLVVDYNNQSGQ